MQPVKFLMSISVPVALPEEHLQHLLVAALVKLEQQLQLEEVVCVPTSAGCVSL